MNTSKCKGQREGRERRLAHVLACTLGLSLCCGVCLVSRGDGSLPEYQVKALFLLNFTKYVDWPPQAFAGSNTPITIGIYGESKLGEALQHVVAGKSFGSRTIVIRQIQSVEESAQCQILFISDSAASRMSGVLDHASALPILTVGESAAFAQHGGIINFALRNGNVRLEIDLAAARKAGLTISSRLLAVADVVKGKPD